MGKVLSWGKCTVEATPVAGTGAEGTAKITFPTPIEDSTQLTTTQGDKNEARVEGGAVEAARYNANSYELVFGIRLHSGLVQLPLKGTDGVIPGEYSVVIKPENSAAPAITINRASANVQVNFTADEGLTATYTFSSLVNDSGEQIAIAVASAS